MFAVFLDYRTKEGVGALKKRIFANLANIILIAIVAFLAVDIGFSLYNPNRLNPVLPFGTLKIIGGDVQMQGRYSLAWERARDGMRLAPGSRLRTGAASHASISFAAGVTTRLAPGTDVTITGLEGDGKQSRSVRFRQQMGRTWNQVGQIADGYHFQIDTPSATVMVRGTLFATEVDGSGKTTVQATEGAVTLKAQGREVTVPASYQAEVSGGQPPSEPMPLPPAESEVVLTVGGPAFGLMVDPSGGSIGYLADGTAVNEVFGALLSPPGASRQTIRLREPEGGLYTVILSGVSGGSVTLSVEAFREGRSVLLYHDSCNVTAGDNFILKLHLDVLNGILGKADGAKPVLAAAENSPPPSPKARIVAAGNEEPVFSLGSLAITSRWVAIGSTLVIFFVVFFIFWKRT